MNIDARIINGLLDRAGLQNADAVHHLGHGELNNSYKIDIGTQTYCLRIAKYTGKSALAREADALSRLPVGLAPRLIFFDADMALDNHLWIIESYIEGITPKRLDTKQFFSLGSKLAQIHAIPAPAKDVVDKGEVSGNRVRLWDHITWLARSFYSEDAILNNLPDKRLHALSPKIKSWFVEKDRTIILPSEKYLLHKDITPSNILVRDDECFLIDWELRGFGDPMMEFSTGFWDIDLNNGKWRISLTDVERSALYAGYTAGGGTIDEGRIDVWTMLDKFGVALFLCYRIHTPTHDTTPELQNQYRTDLDAILESLHKHIY